MLTVRTIKILNSFFYKLNYKPIPANKVKSFHCYLEKTLGITVQYSYALRVLSVLMQTKQLRHVKTKTSLLQDIVSFKNISLENYV